MMLRNADYFDTNIQMTSFFTFFLDRKSNKKIKSPNKNAELQPPSSFILVLTFTISAFADAAFTFLFLFASRQKEI